MDINKLPLQAPEQTLSIPQNTDYYDMQQIANIQASIEVFNTIIAQLTPSLPKNAFNKVKEKDMLDLTIETIVRLV